MDSAWRNDLFTFAMHRKVGVAYGSKKKRTEVIESDAEYVVINYDGVNIVEEVIAKGGFDLIIIDEATHYKNAQTKRWKTLKRLMNSEPWLWMMTGTPAAQSPVDAFGLARLPKPDATETVYQVLQPAIRYTKDECLDLPPMVYVKREVALTRQQNKYYKLLQDKLVMDAGGEQVSAANAAVAMNKLLQISCGAVYTDTGDTLEFDISHRNKVLREVIDESSKKACHSATSRCTWGDFDRC